MSLPKLYLTYASPPVRAVLLTAATLGVKLEHKLVNLTEGEHKSQEYLKMNPQHTLPTLDDNGFILWDSHAISTYLVGKYGPENCALYPKDLQIRARIDQRLHFNGEILFNRLRAMVVPIVFFNKSEVDQEARNKVHEAYEFLEAFLQTDPWLVGNNVTLADLCCVTSVTGLFILVPAPEDKYPKINAWCKRCMELPHYAEVNQQGLDDIRGIIEAKLGNKL